MYYYHYTTRVRVPTRRHDTFYVVFLTSVVFFLSMFAFKSPPHHQKKNMERCGGVLRGCFFFFCLVHGFPPITLFFCVRDPRSWSLFIHKKTKKGTHIPLLASRLTALQFLRSFARARTRATDFEESLVMRSFQPRGVFAASSSPSSWCCSSSLASSRETRERFHSKKRFFYPAAGVKSGRFFPATVKPLSSSSSSSSSSEGRHLPLLKMSATTNEGSPSSPSSFDATMANLDEVLGENSGCDDKEELEFERRLDEAHEKRMREMKTLERKKTRERWENRANVMRKAMECCHAHERERGEGRTTTTSSSGVDFFHITEDVINNDVNFCDEDVFRLPVVPVSYPVLPGENFHLYTSEPRFQTLFGKLIFGEEVAAISPSTEDQDEPVINFDADIFSRYESIDYKSRNYIDKKRTLVAGHNRLNEDMFAGTNAFVTLFLDGKTGKLSGNGVKMNIDSYDVHEKQDGYNDLSIYASASSERIRVLRVVQTAPYIIVDAIQVCDAKVEEEEEKKEELHLREIKESFFDFLRKYSRTGEEDSSILQRGGEYLSTSFVFEGEFSKDEPAGFAESDISYLRRNKVIKDEYALGSIFLRRSPDLTLRLLASNSRKERIQIISKAAPVEKERMGALEMKQFPSNSSQQYQILATNIVSLIMVIASLSIIKDALQSILTRV